MSRTLSIDEASATLGVRRKSLLNLSYADRKHGRDDRFVQENGELRVKSEAIGYNAIEHNTDIQKITTAYQHTLFAIAGHSDWEIACNVSKRTHQKPLGVYNNIKNFKFANPKRGQIVLDTLKEICSRNPLLFSYEELER
jgi:hypothetical protein